jgi:beta-lactamase superfamily II metal-dependent hydrolase
MLEVDFLPVGKAGRHGDAIALRFSRPDGDGFAHVVIDAGFEENGPALVEHFDRYYGTRSVDIALLTHPDADHIGGMGTVLSELRVNALCVHRLGERGGASLPAAQAVDELIELAESRGTTMYEPFAGLNGLGGAFRILGPTEDYYDELVAAQVAEAEERAGRGARSGIAAAIRQLGQQMLAALPREVPFGDAGGTNPRNNSSAITLLTIERHRLFFPADAGVPAIDRALDWAQASRIEATRPNLVQLPHHGSRHNASSDLLNRLLGEAGQAQTRIACVNVAPEAEKHPSPRVANGFMRRGYHVHQTKGNSKRYSDDAPPRPGWSTSTPLQPLDESHEGDD